MNVSDMKQTLEEMSFEELLQLIDLYRLRKLEAYIRSKYPLPVTRSLSQVILNIMNLVDELPDSDFDDINNELEKLITVDDLRVVK